MTACTFFDIFSLGSTSPATHRLFQANLGAPKRPTPPSGENVCLHYDTANEGGSPPLKQARIVISADIKHNGSQLGVTRQQAIPYPFGVIQVNIPVNLQKALKCIVIGHYVEVFRSVYSHLAKVTSQHTSGVSGTLTGFTNGDAVAFEFGLGTVQRLPIQALTHPALMHSGDYECILQLIMEAILMAPNCKENLDKLLQCPNLKVPESLQLLYRARLPSVATDEELRVQLASQSSNLAERLREEQHQTNFAASKNALYLAQVYDATAYINRHQQGPDFRAVLIQKIDFHERAMQERQSYEPGTHLSMAMAKLESTRSAHSQGLAFAEMATNGPERPMNRREHANRARVLNEEAINKHVKPLLEILHMSKGMSEGAALVANLRFDEMMRMLRPAQLDYVLHSSKWSEEERKKKLKHHMALIVNEFDRIRDQLSDHTTVVPVLEDLLAEMEDKMTALKEDVARCCIKGFTLKDPSMSN